MRIASILLVAAFLLSASHQPAGAAWPHDPLNGNLPVCTATGDQALFASLSDGAGGVFIAWIDGRATLPDLYAQHVSATGAPLWAANGVPVCTNAGSQAHLAMASDGDDGVIIVWEDGSFADWNLLAQRIDASGTVQWTTNGVAVCTATGNQMAPAIVPDGQGGAFLAWQDYRSGAWDIYAQRINADCVPQWTANGVAVCTATDAQSAPALAASGADGVIVAWTDNRPGPGNSDIYAQRLLSNGTGYWPPNGFAVCNATGYQTTVTMMPEGSGGAIMTWSDARTGSYDVYAQSVSAEGATRWGSNGLGVCTATGDQLNAALATDGLMGAIFCWQDYRSGSQYDAYAQSVNGLGAIQWAADGVALCTAAANQVAVKAVSDGAGGAIATWSDSRNGWPDIYAQRVSASGAPAWMANGVALCNAGGTQAAPGIVSDGAAGAIVTWTDNRSGSGIDLYAQRVERYGYAGSPEPSILAVRDVLNDQGGQVKVSWSASYLDPAGDGNFEAYDLWRSVPSALAAAQVAGGRKFTTSLAEAMLGHEQLFTGIAGAAGYAWEFVATQRASHYLSSYSYVAPTLGDSLAGSNPATAFLVVGRNASGSMAWVGAPDSGYSVDNIPPLAPSAFAGTWAGGATALQWNACGEADLAGYHVYRGGTLAFVPGPGNRVASTTGTSVSDPASRPYIYKLTAVDIHGNESAPVVLVPAGTADVGDGAPPPALALAPPFPNPAVHGTLLRFALPVTANVALNVFDAAGRLVRTLASGAMPAGEHAAPWDLRDAGGRIVGAGLYFARLEAGDRTLTRRIAVAP